MRGQFFSDLSYGCFNDVPQKVGVSWDNEGLFDALIDLIAYVFRYFLRFPAMDLYVISK